jgi:hypothetical protein
MWGLMKLDNMYLTLVWILFTSTAPFEFYALIPHHPYKYLAAFVLAIMLMIMLLKKLTISIDFVVWTIVLQILYSLMTIFIHANSGVEFNFDEDGVIYINLFIQLLAVLIVYLYIVSQGLMRKLAISFIWVMAIMSIFGGIVFFLGLLANLSPFSSTLIPDHREILNYIFSFAPSEAVVNYGSGSLIRVSGYFDEPGSFALYLTFALLVNKLYGYSKNIERVIVIGGICTLSLAFYISLFFYYLYFSIIEKQFRVMVVIPTVLSIAIISITALKDDSDLGRSLYGLTVFRIQPADMDDGKLIAGDNRSENLVYAWSAFNKAPFFGHGKNAHSNPNGEFFGKLCCNPMHPFATEGIIGTVIYFFVFIYIFFYIFAKRPFDWVSLGAFIILMLNMAQRPGFHHGAFGYFLFIFILEAIKWHKKQLVQKTMNRNPFE